MSTTTIAGLTAVTAVNLTDAAVFEVEDALGNTCRTTIAQIRTQLSTGLQVFTAGVKSGSGAVATTTGVATTLFSPTVAGLYIVSTFLNFGGSGYSAYTVYLYEGSALQPLTRVNGSNLTQTNTASAVQTTQTSGSNQTVNYSYLFISV